MHCPAFMCFLTDSSLDYFPQVHKRATECINAHNILEKIHSGDCPKNLLKDNSVLQQLKVFPLCLYVYFVVYVKY